MMHTYIYNYAYNYRVFLLKKMIKKMYSNENIIVLLITLKNYC